MINKPFFAFAMLCAALCSVMCCAQEKSDWKKAIAALQESRRSIVSGEFILESAFSSAKGESLVYSRHIWFDAEHGRCDTATKGKSGEQSSCFGCYGVDKHVFSSSEELPDGKKLVITIRDLSRVNLKTEAFPDPRWLGLMALDTGLWRNYDMESYLNTRSKHAEVSATTVEGQACMHIRYSGDDNKDHTLDIDLCPTMNYAVLKLDYNYNSPEGLKKSYRDVVDVTNSKHGEMYFPTKVKYARYSGEDGMKPVREETTDVKVLQLNGVIDESVFSLARTPAARKGTLVQWLSRSPPPANGNIYWDGANISALPSVQPISKTSYWSRLTLVAIGFLIVGAYLLGFRKSKSTV